MANAVERSLHLLMLLATNQAPGTVSEVAARLNTSVASASRMIQVLVDAGAVERDPQTGKLEIALGMTRLGAAAIRPLEFRRVVLPAFAAAMPDFERPINLGAPRRADAIWIETLSLSGRYVSSTLMGVPIPYHASTMGKVMLAFLPQDFAESIMANLPLQRYTDKTIVDVAELRAELASIRDLGFAFNRGELLVNGLAVGVPLLDAEGGLISAFSVPASSDELIPDGELVRSLARLGRSISQILGYARESHHSFA